ncbi:hypothetical protein AA103196_1655 [Ameyamaea chiangmaiensis NBRC 103196]|uniref:DUF4089 domain-containing protein n=1 Tax=Ameyamaea chiangmaiensis TaxID=442969 RepID=A0A850PE56_9PROT|nr:DUF4089 domain-containing protein [Ameyamaea chiangmaiensis]MBS4074079.1 DUF4089 domain-containing protein [Ameyamaea chiangmaiensis]NVN40546.1 DUF4089 domain-containing protein [Ameyamaea chiangmaiensis]GBQ67322.1 hypothetical protein AA103196_1655 [Ameyamaea chiangmaiensis NBRC 103196]
MTTHDESGALRDPVFAIEAIAASIGLTIPPECLPGVLANTRILTRYADLVEGASLDDTVAPAFGYAP